MTEEDIQNIFFVECEESLEAAEAGLDACSDGTHDDETINAIFRAVHSIKGGAGAFGHTAMQAFTHTFENLLGDVREGKIGLNDELVNLMLVSLDLLRDHVDAARDGGDSPEDSALIKQLEAARNGEPASAPPAEPPVQVDQEPTPEPMADDAGDPMDDLDSLLDELSDPSVDASGDSRDDAKQESEGSETEETKDEGETWLIHIRPHAGAMDNGTEPVLWLRELTALGGQCIECEYDGLPQLDQLDVDAGYLGWTFRMPGSVSQDEVQDIFDFVGDDCSLAIGNDATMPPSRAVPVNEAPPIASPEPAPKSEPASAPSQTPAPAPAPAAATKAAPVAKKEEKPDAKGDGAAKKAAPAAAKQSLRIELGKLDKLIDGVGELVIAQSMLSQRLTNENVAHIEELALLDNLVRDIQERAMAFRAQPVSSVFGRIPRLLRELSVSTGKHVKLEVQGETTELDKTVIERLGEPMTHLIRNAVDHGIETPEERKEAGKDPEGKLTLSAEQRAGRVVIEIADDGRGINRERVFAKAVANGLISEDAQLSDEEIDALVFAPGFSTAQQVSNISGRGVGMDVVKQNVKDLGGRVSISSEPGKGTVFSLALPLTMAISDGMIVQAGDQTLVIPLTHVVESVRPSEGDLKGMGTHRSMLNVRGQFVPVLSLGQMTGASDWISNPCEGVLILVETEGAGRAALLVDAITDQRQFVIKSLDSHYRSIEGVAGATILGNGQVALIMDIDRLVQSEAGNAQLADAA